MTSPSHRPRSWWLYYLVAVAMGVLAGVVLFDLVTT